MSQPTKAFQIMTVHGRPVIHVPEYWDATQVASLVQKGFGIQISQRKHEVMPYTDDVSTITAYTNLVMNRIIENVTNHPQARQAMLDIVGVAGIEIVLALDFYDMTATEMSKLYTQIYTSDAKAFHRALVTGQVWDTLRKLREQE